MALSYDPFAFESWRENYEMRQSLMWLAGFVWYDLVAIFVPLSGISQGCAVICAAMGMWKWPAAMRRYRMTVALAGTPIPTLKFDDLKKLMRDKVHLADVWDGKGFVWSPKETQRIYNLFKMDWNRAYRDALGAVYFVRYFKSHWKTILFHPFYARHEYIEIHKRIAQTQGFPFIHGVNPVEENLFQSIKDFEGHTLVIGTTGSGKTRCFDLFISQAILRNEPVFIIDPKGDHDLMAKAKRACEKLGRGDKFVYFHPAFPQNSIRINPLANWSRITEIADRISSLMPSGGTAATFTAFAFQSLSAICTGLCMSGRTPTIKSLYHYLAGMGSGAVASLVIDAIDNYLTKVLPNARLLIDKAIQTIPDNKRDQETVATTLVGVYQAGGKPDPDMDNLISLYTHNREHFGKMITSLLPVLSMLCSGVLGDMLSPSEDLTEQRKYTWRDTADLIDSNHVVYMGLDSLSDPMVGAYLGALFLSDLACVAGSKYNFEGKEPAVNLPRQDVKESFITRLYLAKNGKLPKMSGSGDIRHINLFVDEASEVVNMPFLQLLNKGRGAGFRLFVATQTLSDFAARLGSKDEAMRFLGNMNNKICLRIVDPDTQKFISNLFGETIVKNRDISQSNSSSENAVISGNRGERLSEQKYPLIPPTMLGMLPNLEYIASLSGRVVKGRYPLILE